MELFLQYLKRPYKHAHEEYGISSAAAKFILFVPFLFLLLYILMFAVPVTRKAAYWSLEENHPVEMLTFFFLLAGGVKGIALTLKLRRIGERHLVVWAYTTFSMAILIVAFEEIAWGQAFFGFETPEYWKTINLQGETTLHNIPGVQGRSEIFRLIFGVGGLIGLGFRSSRDWKKIATPSLLLFWLALITTHAAVDVLNDYFPIQERFDRLMQRTSEVIEMMIGMSAFLYIYLNERRLLNVAV